MNQRSHFVGATTLQLRAWAVAVLAGLGVCAAACEEESGSDEYFRGTVDSGDFAADPNAPGTSASCSSGTAFAYLTGVNAEGDELRISLDTCAPGSYGIVPTYDDTTTGVLECNYEPATGSALYQSRSIYTDSSCNVVIDWPGSHAVGTAQAVLIDYDIATGHELDRVSVNAEFKLVVDTF